MLKTCHDTADSKTVTQDYTAATVVWLDAASTGAHAVLKKEVGGRSLNILNENFLVTFFYPKNVYLSVKISEDLFFSHRSQMMLF